MFEKYTERARRVIFFARYEASQFGSPLIETEHILLGLFREDRGLAARFFPGAPASIHNLRKEIERFTTTRERIPISVDIPFSEESKRVLTNAADESVRMNHRFISSEHLLLGLLREEKSVAAEILRDYGIRASAIREEMTQAADEKHSAPRAKNSINLLEFSKDLTEMAANDALDPLVGRKNEVERLIQILCRRTKNNPVLIGEPGVGKTAIVEGLAQKIVSGEAPRQLCGKRVLALDLSLVVAGTKYRGQFEERMKLIMRELIDNRQYIVFIDELHTLIGAGSAEGSLDAANIMKPALARGELQCIGASTPYEYRRFIEKDRSLERRFQSVRVAPPSEEESIAIMEGVREKYERFHAVRYADEALRAAVSLSSRYIPDRFLPDKAIDVLDEAGARVKLRESARETTGDQANDRRGDRRLAGVGASREYGRRSSYYGLTANDDYDYDFFRKSAWREPEPQPAEVVRKDIEEVIARWTGIPMTSLEEEESARLLRMEEELHRRLVGQNRAISSLCKAIRRSRAGLTSHKRPVGSFLFLGPTGVGKTETARSLASFLFGSDSALLRVDMSEYMEKHSVSRLIGSPPGYVGHEEGGQLTEKIRRNPYSVLLLDEIEKAHPDVHNILLQVFEDGQLTDSLGNAVDFKNAIIIMTSNIGARFLEKRGTLGFQGGANTDAQRLEDLIRGEVKQTFNPEFLNRLDEIIFFDSLTDNDLEEIVGLLVGEVIEAMSRRNVFISLTQEAKKWIVQKTCGNDRSYGARPLRRAIQKYIEDPLAEAIMQNRAPSGANFEIYPQDGVLFYIRRDDASSLPLPLQ
ncbi:MAG: ATP-dependent Clp protease ATP-binding subunit [Acidobacteriota bacterium]|jgi:ATP-dependent Clp protease ATP-binding subunit ClpC|nr:ATP-dependent Clp protease ATP-binding subunit [Acidobacteriota bacterium]